MSENPKASPAIMWLKQLTTGTFSGLAKHMDRITFLRRNKKSLGLILALWLLTVFAGYALLNTTAQKQVQSAILVRAKAADRFADQSATPLLEER